MMRNVRLKKLFPKKKAVDRVMIAYQVLNKFGYPASNDLDDLCVFPSKGVAKDFINHLDEECGHLEDEFTIRKVKITVLKSKRIVGVHG